MLQRAGLAQALLNDPKIVFLDEPQSGLDPFGRKEVRDIILSLRDRGATVFFSSHILSDAELICDRVAILSKGRLINIGAMEEILSAKIKAFEIEASGLPEKMIKDIENKSERIVKRDKTVLFAIEKQEEAEAVVREIVNSPGNLVSYMPRSESLEEYFIRKVESQNDIDSHSHKAN